MKVKVILITIIAVVLIAIAVFVIFRDKLFQVYDKDGMIYSQTTDTWQTGDE